MRIITPTFCRAVLPGSDGWGVPACVPGPGRRAGRGRPRCHGSTRWCAGGHVLRGACWRAGRGSAAVRSPFLAAPLVGGPTAGQGLCSRRLGWWELRVQRMAVCGRWTAVLLRWARAPVYVGDCTGRILSPQAGVARRPGPSDQCGAQSQTQAGAMPKLRLASRAGPGLRPAQAQAQTSAMRRIMSPTSVAVTPIIPIMPAVVRWQRRSRL